LAIKIYLYGFLTDSKYWMELGQVDIEKALNLKHNLGVAKNVILFVGDGMGMATITATRIHKGQTMGNPGEEGYLTFEKFNNVGLLKVGFISNLSSPTIIRM